MAQRLRRISALSPYFSPMPSKKITIGILAAVALALLATFFVWNFLSPAKQLARAVDEQFVAISVENFDKAFTYLSKGKKSSMTKDDLRYYAHQHPVLWSNIKRDVKDVSIDANGMGGNETLALENADGLKETMSVFLIKEDDQWKIVSYAFPLTDTVK